MQQLSKEIDEILQNKKESFFNLFSIYRWNENEKIRNDEEKDKKK